MLSMDSNSSGNYNYIYSQDKFIGRVLVGSRKYPCYKCGKVLRDSRTLGRHLREFHMLAGYKCVSQLPKGCDEDLNGKILNQDIEAQNLGEKILKSPRSEAARSPNPEKAAKRICIHDLRYPTGTASETPPVQSSSLNQAPGSDVISSIECHELGDIESSMDFTSTHINEPPGSNIRNQSESRFPLEEYGLHLYMGKLFHCPTCKCLLLPSEAATHWGNNHSKGSPLLSTGSKANLQKKLEQCILNLHGLSHSRDEFISSLPPLNERPPFQHFELESGYQCSVASCTFVRTSLESMRKHIQNTHSKKEMKQIPVDCQNIWFTCLANQTRYIAVNKHMMSGQGSRRSLHVLSHELLGTPWRTASTVTEKDANLGEMSVFERQTAAFLHNLGYTDRVKGIPIQEILAVVQPTTLPTFFVMLRGLCLEYILITQRRIQEAMVQAPFLLRKLEHDGVIVKDKLRILEQKTVRYYSLFVARFVSFVLRVLQGSAIPALLKICLTEGQKQAFSELFAKLQSTDVQATAVQLEISLDYGDTSADSISVINLEDEEDEAWCEDEDEGILNWALSPAPEPTTDYIEEGQNDFSAPMEALHKSILSCFQLDSDNEEATLLSVLSSYVVFLSLQTDGKFKSPIKQTPGNARLKYLGKAAFLNELFYQAFKDGRSSPLNRDWDILSHWASQDPSTPYMWLARVQSKLSYHALRDVGLSIIAWNNEKNKLSYEDHEISMEAFEHFIISLHGEVHTKLSRLLLGIPIEDLTQDLTSYTDNVQSQDKYYNFLSNCQGVQGDYTYPLYTRLRRDPAYFSQADSDTWLPNHDRVSEYLQWAKDFVLCLFTAIYFTSGMPPRATELLATLCRNTPSRLRDIFAMGPELVFQSVYLKTNVITQSVGHVLRLLSPPIAKAVLIYLKDVVPVICFLTQKLYPSVYARGLVEGGTDHDHPYFTHLFAVDGAVLQPHTAYQYLKTRTEKHFGFPLGISDARHILKAIGRQYIPSISISNPILEIQANHGVSVARQHYAITKSMPKGVSEEEAHHFFYISKYWQYLWGYRDFSDLPISPETKIAQELFRVLLQAETTINLAPETTLNLEAPSLWQDENLTYSSDKNTYEVLLKAFQKL